MICPDCDHDHKDGTTCEEDFYTLLGWENEYPGYGVVHHLLVCATTCSIPACIPPRA